MDHVRWILGIGLASLAASTVLGYAMLIQHMVEGTPSAEIELGGPSALVNYIALTSVLMFLPVALVGFLTDSALRLFRREELWAYAVAGLMGGGLIGWVIGFGPLSDDEVPGPKIWRLALFGLIASSTFWAVVRRKR